MQTCPKCGEQDDWLQKCTRCGEEWRESSIPSTDLLCAIMQIADHQIPGYAYGDNEAACDMDMRLREIYAMARAPNVVNQRAAIDATLD